MCERRGGGIGLSIIVSPMRARRPCAAVAPAATLCPLTPFIPSFLIIHHAYQRRPISSRDSQPLIKRYLNLPNKTMWEAPFSARTLNGTEEHVVSKLILLSLSLCLAYAVSEGEHKSSR